MRSLEAWDVLALWERGATRHAIDRSALLCAWTRPDLEADAIVDWPLGRVTATLLRLRASAFGPRIHAHVDCERCAERLSMTVVGEDLLQPTTADEGAVHDGLIARAPTLRDLAAVVDEPDETSAARRLLERCVRSGAVGTLTDATLRDAEDAIEDVDPNADLAFDVRCPACGHVGTAQLDAGALLWDELESRAHALLGEVHVLARSYGWTEGDVLALTPARRATYLALATAP